MIDFSRPILLNLLILGTAFVFPAAPLAVAGTLDTSFNPSGLTITATGASVDLGGYAGSLIIDLGGNELGGFLDIFQIEAGPDRILLGGTTTTGPRPFGNNFALVALKPDGTLDSSFNPSGFSITHTGASVDFGGYAGSLIIDLGLSDYAYSTDAFRFFLQEDRIIIGGKTDLGPPGSLNNFALILLTSTGILDHSFNPSGLTITATGASVDLGGYAGSLVIDLGGNESGGFANAHSFTTQGDRIIVAGRTNAGPVGSSNNIGLLMITPTGALDHSFNPSGLTITATGASLPLGGYAGSLIIDLGGNEFGGFPDSFNFTTQGDRILIGASTTTGLNPLNIALVLLTPTGTLDRSFNPSGRTITATGASVDLGGYAGSLIIDLGGSETTQSINALTLTNQGDRILLGGQTNTGPDPLNLALVMLTATGALDHSFNPSGLTITATGASVSQGGYAGSLIIDLGGSERGGFVDLFTLATEEDRIVLGGRTSVGLNPDNFALIILTSTGLLDQSFNPSGFFITQTGASIDLGGYAGSLIIDLGGDERAYSTKTCKCTIQENRIIIAGRTDTGPVGSFNNFALVALHGETLFAPQPNAIHCLAALPFIIMAAA